MNKKTKSFLLSVLTLSFIFYSCSNLANDLQKRKNQNLYNITIQETSNGTVTAAKSSGIKAGEEVILSVTATSGYELKTISVTNTQNKDVAVAAMEQGTSYKFTMPASDVTVGAAFAKTGPVDITEPGDLNNSSGDTVYKIEHCQQSLTDTGLYDLVAIQYKRGNAGNQTNAVSNDFPGFTALAFDQQTINSNGNTIVRIYYDRNVITYTFDPNGGNWDGSTDPIVLSGLYEAVVNTPEEPSVNGYTFIGWDGTNLQLFGPENQTIIACWDAHNNTSYTIREYIQSIEGGNNYTLDKEYQRTGSVSSFSPDTKTGFEFQNKEPLYLDSDGNAFMNVYWNRLSYTVSFNTMGGSTIPSQQILYEAKMQLPRNPEKSGYTFYTWCTNSSCSNDFDPNSGIRNNLVLYAFWIDNSITYDFHETVTRLNGADGTAGSGIAEYVLFGDYPQHLLSDDTVTFEETRKMRMGDWTVYSGSDGNLYYKYNGNYYKVEPIKWRVLSRDDNNIAVLLAENILDEQYYIIDEYNYYSNSFIYIDSDIRSFLNDIFLFRAFTSTAQNLIEITEIDSDPFNYFSYDKIYLLQYSELCDTNLFHNWYCKRRQHTEFSNALFIALAEEDDGDCWWLRTVELNYFLETYYPCFVDIYEVFDRNRYPPYYLGVVPALSIYLPPAD